MRHRSLELSMVRRGARVLRCIAHPMRLRLVECLSGGERSVQALTEATQSEQAVVSKHLSRLREAGLVARRKDRNYRYYYLERPEVLKILDCMRSACKKGE